MKLRQKDALAIQIAKEPPSRCVLSFAQHLSRIQRKTYQTLGMAQLGPSCEFLMKSMSNLLEPLLLIAAIYCMPFGFLISLVGLFSGPHILIPGLLHIAAGFACILVIRRMLKKANSQDSTKEKSRESMAKTSQEAR